jgi:hypothetical protein
MQTRLRVAVGGLVRTLGSTPAPAARFTPSSGSARQLAIIALSSVFLMPLLATASSLEHFHK